MSLSCDCDTDYDDWWFTPPDDYSTLQTKQRRRCCSCNQLIDKGAVVLKFECWRSAQTDIEERINGDEVPLADKFMCESCGDIFYSLTELGFCIQLGGHMKETLAEYHEYVKEHNGH